MCSATFTLDSGTEPVGELDIGIELVNARQEVVSVDHLTVAPFGTSEATRYQTTYAEGEHYCDDTLSIRITSLAEVDSGVHKRLPLSLITPRHFRPFTIVTAPRDK
ncbi:IrmA family protein [Kosakonia sp. SMBL-WEM22]|uniref:IrmA family protein n=1 Tax=Kosakonia sp. SMBL-WEM22 TaxID=2725560 RepID=UPI002012CDEC|nr:IrmA family protein [Kosakonia sp. SMBL-WEM22]